MARLSRVETQVRTRQRLVEAAGVVFARRGFHAASIEQVAKEAEYTKGAVYSNFRSKDDLFLAVLETHLQERVEFYKRLAEQARSQPGQDLAGLLPRLDESGEPWCLLQLEFWLYAMRRPAVRRRMVALYRQYRAHLAPLTIRYARSGIKPSEVVAATIALYHGLTLQWHSDPRAIRPDMISRILRALDRRRRSSDRYQPARRAVRGRRER